MRKTFGIVLALLAVSMMSFGQINADMNEDPLDPNFIAQMTFCLPITYYSDSIVTLLCDGVYMEIPAEKLKQEFVIVIKPNAVRDTTLLPGKKVINYYLPEENNDPALKE